MISWAKLHEHHQGSAETHPGGVQGTPQAVVRGLQRCHLRKWSRFAGREGQPGQHNAAVKGWVERLG